MSDLKKKRSNIMTFKTYYELNETTNKNKKLSKKITYYDPSKNEPWVLIVR